MELITLKARKVRTTEHGYTGYKTEFYQDGKLFATIPLGSRQPKTGQKTIWLNGWKWALEWEPVVLVRFYIEPVGGQVMAYFPKEIHSFNGYRPAFGLSSRLPEKMQESHHGTTISTFAGTC